MSIHLSRGSVQLCLVAVLLALALSGCGTKQGASPDKYKGDIDEMMPIPYTPRDDGSPLTSDELHAFKTVSDLDRHLSEEDARIVELHFKFFVHEKRRTFERFLERSARFLPHIKKTFTARGIPEDVSYLCMVESGGNPIARSPVGAAGLWQFMPFTGRKYGLKQDNWVDERRDPYKASYAASDYLLKLYNDFSNWHLAVAAYNAGEGKIGRAVSGTGAKDFFELCLLDCQLEERARLKNETRDYVPRLIAVAKIMRNLKRLGFKEPTPDMAWDLKPLNVPPGTNLAGLAKRLNLSWEEFSGMNPAYLRNASPPNAESTAYVPPDQLATAVNYVASSEARSFAGWKEYTVKKGDSLASIAKRHRISVAALKEANGFDRLPGRGATIVIPTREQVEQIQDARPAASSSQGAVTSYTVRPGDTLSILARQWGTDVSSIQKANKLNAKSTALRPGQRLAIPANAKTAPKAPRAASQPPAASAPAGSGSQYTVKAGDTIFGIARSTGVSVDALCAANNLNQARPNIRTGQRLLIPGRSGTVEKSSPAGKPAAVGGKPTNTQGSAGKTRNVTVKSGDTLYNIARANNVPVQALQKANKLGANAKLKIGQKLIIP